MKNPPINVLTNVSKEAQGENPVQTHPKLTATSSINNSVYPMIKENDFRLLARKDSYKAKKQKQNQENGYWPRDTTKKVVLAFILILSICTAALVPSALILLIFRNQGSDRASNHVRCASYSQEQTCIGMETSYPASSGSILYTFDGSVQDVSSSFDGIPVGTYALPTYSIGDYSGSAIVLNASFQQYVNLPYINLRNTSFTIETWLLPIKPAASNHLPNDFPIFGQCDKYMKCLLITLRAGRIQLSFDSMNSHQTLISSSIISFGVWTHVAIVYDVVAFQQRIYVNGIIDAVSDIVLPFQGSSMGATTNIGFGVSSMYSFNSFNGKLGQFWITQNVAKPSCNIYNDALLAAYFPFNTNRTYDDYSAGISKTMASSVYTVPGRINEALVFSSENDSFFQSLCFPNPIQNHVFTLSLWVNPAQVIGGGTIVHLSSDESGDVAPCIDLIALTSNGTLIVQIPQSSSSAKAISGPSLIPNTWTHLALVYSNRHGMRLFINGTLKNAYPSFIDGIDFWFATWGEVYVTLGNSQTVTSITSTCLVGALPIVSGGFSGMIDEFRLYLTELNGDDLYRLANPRKNIMSP